MSFIPRRKIDTLLLSLGMKNAWFYLMMFVTWIQFFFGQSFLIIFFLIFSCMILRWRWLREQARIVHCSGHSNFSDQKNFIVNQKAESLWFFNRVLFLIYLLEWMFRWLTLHILKICFVYKIEHGNFYFTFYIGHEGIFPIKHIILIAYFE